MKYDFAGYVTKNNVRCADGRVILQNAFEDCNGKTVPMVWQHLRDDPENVIGNVKLENRPDGVYGYATFNNNPKALAAKEAVRHGDVDSMSIFANHLAQNGRKVQHGFIREVSLVIAGANPEARITDVSFKHSDDEYPDEVIISMGEKMKLNFEHADDDSNSDAGKDKGNGDGKSDKTLEEVFNTLNEDQKTLLYALVGQALGGDDEEDEDESAEHDDEGDDDMKYNAFDKNSSSKEQAFELTHDDMAAIMDNAKRCGSLKTAVEDACLEHGITDLEILFPEAKAITNVPQFIGEPEAWVNKVWGGTHKSPFSRIKSLFADITMEEARAKGYIKGKKKQEEQFSLLKRVTTPQTVYKKQKLDRDDIIDITGFDVVTWMKGEMRGKLTEELARAVLIGDGRTPGAEDKINESNIRSILNDDDMYTIKQEVQPDEDFIDIAVLARVKYKGSGSPVLFADPTTIAKQLIRKDNNGRRIYNTMSELASAMMVREIVEVPLMEGLKRKDSSDQQHEVYGIIVNLSDYNIGADRGGAVSLFDNFDIDYNKYTYLIETRCSGALIKPYSAIVLEGPATTSA